jgi:site-specific DNA-methyltransferase (adenine-specific)
VCEKKERHWLGMEIDFADEIAARIENHDVTGHRNDDFVEA